MKGLSCYLTTFNEEKRIHDFLRHAVCWADEVLIADKGSTDRTVEIAKGFGEKVKIRNIGYSDQGFEDTAEIIKTHGKGWYIVTTPGDVPTRDLIFKLREIIKEDSEGRLDAIRVPRKTYSFGKFKAKGHWGITYIPCVVRAESQMLSSRVHEVVKDEACTAKIRYSEDTHILHQTHAESARFLRTHAGYAIKNGLELKARGMPGQKDDYSAKRIAYMILKRIFWWKDEQYHAWKMYKHAIALTQINIWREQEIRREYKKRQDDYVELHWVRS